MDSFVSRPVEPALVRWMLIISIEESERLREVEWGEREEKD